MATATGEPLVAERTHAGGKPLIVEVAAEVMHCWDLDVKTESFCIELVVYTRWQAQPEAADEIMRASGGDENESWEPEW